jgi:phage gp46-like protein
MTSNGKHDQTLPDPTVVLDTIIEHVAEDEAENGSSTEADEQWAQALHQKMAARIAVMRRQLTPLRAPITAPSPIRSKLYDLHREQLLARIAALVESGTVQYAHQDLTRLSDADLRRLLTELSPATKD